MSQWPLRLVKVMLRPSEWIAEAKREDTRARRVEQAVEWLSAGKHRNWKYER